MSDEVIVAESQPVINVFTPITWDKDGHAQAAEPVQIEPTVPLPIEPVLAQAFYGESESVPAVVAPKVYTGLITRSELEERIGEIKDALHRHGIG